MKNLKPLLAGSMFLLASVTPTLVLAGGGLVSTEVYPNSGRENFNVPPGEQFIVKPQVHLDNEDPYDLTIRWCKGCPIKVKLENPQPDDVINQSSDKTDDNGQIYAKVISKIQGVRYVYSEVTLPNGQVYTGSQNSLNYAPSYIYGQEPQPTPTSVVYPKPTAVVYPKPSIKPNITVNTGQIKTPPTYPTTSAKPGYPSKIEEMPKVEKEASLEAKVNQLEQKLEESEKRQSLLEQKLNDLINYLKSLFS